ncbi:MAG: GNAT family N-acetyltransferase [Bacteroidota bacterium]
MKSVSPIHFTAAMSPEAIAAAQAIRKQVFVEEQGIPIHREADGFDGLSSHILGSLDDQTPVAVARLTMLKPEIGLITRVAILPSYRGKGYGRALLMAIENLARENGAKRLAVKPHADAEGFYARMGYQRGEAPPDPVEGYTLVTMEKTL